MGFFGKYEGERKTLDKKPTASVSSTELLACPCCGAELIYDRVYAIIYCAGCPLTMKKDLHTTTEELFEFMNKRTG